MISYASTTPPTAAAAAPTSPRTASAAPASAVPFSPPGRPASPTAHDDALTQPDRPTSPTAHGDALARRLGQRRKALVPYVTGGITENWTDYLLAYAAAGADAIEIGLPFSDPMLDGATIQQASDRALARGITVASILSDLSEIKVDVPLIVMTYANLVFRSGAETFCRRLAEAGVSGLIVPDLPVDEAAAVEEAAAATGLALILLAAPVTPDDRLAEIGARSRGFVYAVSLMGTTGERDTLDAAASRLATRVQAATTLPVLIGFGVSTPAQAAAAARSADGVVVASALMRLVLDGATPDDLRREVAALRSALDEAGEPSSP